MTNAIALETPARRSLFRIFEKFEEQVNPNDIFVEALNLLKEEQGTDKTVFIVAPLSEIAESKETKGMLFKYILFTTELKNYWRKEGITIKSAGLKKNVVPTPKSLENTGNNKTKAPMGSLTRVSVYKKM